MKSIKKIISAVLATAMIMTGATTAFAAESKIDLEAASRITVKFELEGQEPKTVQGDDNMGYPVLLYVADLKGSITYIPIRAICEALGVPVDWVSASTNEEAHAVLSTATGTVKLFLNATSIEASNGTVYEETTYKFSDGSAIPLCLSKNGRIYVPLRAISTFIIPGATFAWSMNGAVCTVKGNSTSTEAPSGFDGVGPNMKIGFNREDPLANMPNAQAVAAKYNLEAGTSNSGNGVYLTGVLLRNTGGWLEIEGFNYSSNNEARYEAALAFIKDSCDSESATAFINWLDGLNEIQASTATDEEFYAYYNQVFSDGNKAQFGNIYVGGNIDSIKIYPSK